MRRPLIVAALWLLSLALVDRGAAVARVGAPFGVKEIVDTTRNDAGQAISLPHGPLQLVASIYTPAPGARLPEHKHPFQRYASVIQGDLEVEPVGSGSKI